MIILGIETSCDETSAAVIEKHRDKIILKSKNTLAKPSRFKFIKNIFGKKSQ